MFKNGKKEKKGMTIDKLASMMQVEFSSIHQEFSRINNILKIFSDRFDKIDADIADIKRALGPILQMMVAQDKEIDDIKMRLNRVERKVGIS